MGYLVLIFIKCFFQNFSLVDDPRVSFKGNVFKRPAFLGEIDPKRIPPRVRRETGRLFLEGGRDKRGRNRPGPAGKGLVFHPRS